MVWKLNAADMADSLRDYRAHCDVIFGLKAGTDEALGYALALGRKNGGFAWMQLLLDVYSGLSRHCAPTIDREGR